MDYRSPIAGLQRQVDELTEELASLRAAPGELELAVADDSELAKLRREAVRAEKQANRHRKKEHARELTPRERMHFARMQGGGVLALVLGGLGAVYLVVMTLLGAPFEESETLSRSRQASRCWAARSACSWPAPTSAAGARAASRRMTSRRRSERQRGRGRPSRCTSAVRGVDPGLGDGGRTTLRHC